MDLQSLDLTEKMNLKHHKILSSRSPLNDLSNNVHDNLENMKNNMNNNQTPKHNNNDVNKYELTGSPISQEVMEFMEDTNKKNHDFLQHKN